MRTPKGHPNNKFGTCDRCGQPFQLHASKQKRCDTCRIPARLELARMQSMDWYYKNPEKARLRRKRAEAKRPDHYREMKRKNMAKRRARVRYLIIGFYSHGTYRCACCGESQFDFLTLDHINGGGGREMIQLFGRRQASSPFYFWLARNGFPSGYQILCLNCNMSKGKHGVCAHRRPVPPLLEKLVTLENWVRPSNGVTPQESDRGGAGATSLAPTETVSA